MRIISIGLFLISLALNSNAQSWGPQQKVNATDRASNDYYGYAVDVSGDFAIVGAYRENTPPPENSNGAAYIYERDGTGNWIEVQKLVPADRAANDRFGWSVAIVANDDAVYAVASATFHDDIGNTTVNGGAVYIFERDPVTHDWVEIAKLISDDIDSWDYFGNAVDITMVDEKGYVIVGVQEEDDDQFLEDNLGAAYIFERTGAGEWIQMQKITSDVRKHEDRFGASVAIGVVGENLFALIGAPLEDDGLVDNNEGSAGTGSAYIFSLDDSDQWNQVQKLIASDRDVTEADFFGTSVDLSNELIVIGAPNDDQDENDENEIVGAGSAYIFEQNEGGSWDFTQKIAAPTRGVTDAFGTDLGVSGNSIIVGAHRHGLDVNDENPIGTAGAAYIFERDNLDPWSLSQKTVAEERQVTDYFGFAVAISDETVLVGAYREDYDSNGENMLADAGSVFFFDKSDDAVCTPAGVPELVGTAPIICEGETVILSIDAGALNDAEEWVWYAGICEGTSIGSGLSIDVIPTSTTTYFARGEGDCVENGSCGEITITVSEPIALSATTTPATTGQDGAIDLNVSGGMPPYSFDWNNDESNDFDDLEDLSNLSADTYEVTVRDDAGCQNSLEVIVEAITSTDELIFESQISIYPNPISDGRLVIDALGTTPISTTIIAYSGNIKATYEVLGKSIIDVGHLPNGLYLIYFDIDGQKSVQRFTKI